MKDAVMKSLSNMGYVVMDNKRFQYVRVIFTSKRGFNFAINLDYVQLEIPGVIETVVYQMNQAIFDEF